MSLKDNASWQQFRETLSQFNATEFIETLKADPGRLGVTAVVGVVTLLLLVACMAI